MLFLPIREQQLSYCNFPSFIHYLHYYTLGSSSQDNLLVSFKFLNQFASTLLAPGNSLSKYYIVD